MLEFLKYNLDEKYIEFIWTNYIYNLEQFDNLKSFVPTRFELLMNTYNAYQYIIENKADSEAVKKFDISKLKNSIDINIEVLFNYYANEEIAMYFANPNDVLSGFYSQKNNFRMRIDDIQHSLSGLILYNNQFN